MIRFFLVIISSITLLTSCTKQTEIKKQKAVVKEVVKEQPLIKEPEKEDKIEISGAPPNEKSEKFLVEDQDMTSYQTELEKPIMIAIVAPLTGKYDMLGNAIMDGAHMALIELFNKDKIPVRLTAIDTGSSIEDMEFNISKLDETQFDIILGLTSTEQKAFVEVYIEHMSHKPQIMSFVEGACSITPRDQMKLINGKPIYVVLPMGETESNWQGDNIKIIQYRTDDLKHTTDDLMTIIQKIESETEGKQAIVVFTEGNWKLQKFMANIDTLKLNDRIEVILASLSQKNSRMETVNEKRHRFGNIGIIAFNNRDYGKFIDEFNRLHSRKPLDISFLAYNIVKSLENSNIKDNRWNFDSISCKPDIKLFH